MKHFEDDHRKLREQYYNEYLRGNLQMKEEPIYKRDENKIARRVGVRRSYYQNGKFVFFFEE
jgi:hypothetical protein